MLLDRIMQIVKTDFPQQTWQMFWLLTVEDQPGVEVARKFGLTPNAVYVCGPEFGLFTARNDRFGPLKYFREGFAIDSLLIIDGGRDAGRGPR